MAVRVSLTERISIEARQGAVDEQRFPGRQGRLVFAYLLAARGRPVPRDELAEALWGEAPPAKWEKALSVLVSKLRALLNECGVDGSASLTSAFGCYQLTLPPESWIDVVAADEAATAADRALAAGDLDGALANASTAAALARRTFLPGEDGRWIAERRAELRDILVRALECQAEATRLAGDAAASARVAEELISLEPFRERGYRLLMQAQSAAGNDAEALRTYERCRTLLAEELGAFPSPETEAIYLEILRTSPRSAQTKVDQLDDLRHPTLPPDAEEPRRGDRRRPAAAVAGAALLLAAAAGTGLALTRGDAATPAVLPTSVVRIDPNTLKPTQVVRIGPRADLVVAAGGYVWITHGVLRYTQSNTVRNAGDRTLTRVEPSSGAVTVVGGGLAPCGLAADPSGDVWVANCYEPASGQGASVVRVDKRTLAFKATWPVPGLGEQDYYRGVAYGGGSLWVSRREENPATVTEVDPRTGGQRAIPLSRPAGALAWSGGSGDLWITNFDLGSITRLHPETSVTRVADPHVIEPSHPIVDGDTVWAGDWERPRVAHFPEVGSVPARRISLPVTTRPAGVTALAAGDGYIWATVPDSHALWRIDPETSRATRVPLKYYPWGVAVDDEGGIWVALRAHDAP